MPDLYSSTANSTNTTVNPNSASPVVIPGQPSVYKGTSVNPSLKDVANNNTIILYELTSIFPFDFFPAKITVDLQKISIIDQLFFFSKQVLSIPIKELFVVECDTNLFFATLRFRDKRYELQPLEIRFLKKSEARKARRIIQGLIAVYDQGLDMAGMSIDDVKVNVEKMGSTLVAA